MHNNIIHAFVVQSKLADRSIAQPIYEEIKQKYSQIKEREDYKRTTGYLMLGPHFIDEDTGLILYPSTMIAQHMGKSHKHCNTTAYLEDYKRDVAPKLDYTGYSAEHKKCRAIRQTGMADLVDAVLEDNAGLRQYFYAGIPASDRNQLALNKRIHQEVKNQQWLYDDQKVIADYLHNRPFPLYKRALDEHYSEFWELTNRQYTNPQIRRHQLLRLQAIRDNPKPYYYPVEDNARIYTRTGPTLLPKEHRRILFPNCIELDLQASHPSIVASRWNVPSILELQKDGASLWDEVLKQMNISEEKKVLAKPILKQGVACITYGMKGGNVNKMVREDLADLAGIPQSKQFSDCSLIDDLLLARERTEADIKANNGAYGAYGFIPLNRLELPSFYSHMLQTFELAIIAEAFKLATERDDFCILLYLYDGFTIQVRPSREDRVIRSLQKAIHEKAKDLGIYTRLTTK